MNNISTAIYDYDLLTKSYLINPIELCKCINNGEPYEDYPYNVTDELINNTLQTNKFIDTKKYPNSCLSIPGYENVDIHMSTEVHAVRIASLVKLILQNTRLDIITIHEHEPANIIIEDGMHRLRAFIYIQKHINPNIKMPAKIYS